MTTSLAIVAYAADQPLSPRGERALAVAEAASRVARTELIRPTGRERFRRNIRRLTHVASPLMLDAWEVEAWWTLRRRRPCPDGALLVGFPFSAVYWAARRLVHQGIPYVVDLGDPWALTLPAGERPPMGRLRASRCERFVWTHARAAIVTTQLQADAISELFDHLPVVVRPNGYQLAQPSAGSAERPAPPLRRTLRLVHYGNLYSSRLDVAPLLARLAGCGKWDSVVFTQQGNDWSGALRGLPAAARVEVGAQQSWEQVVAAAPQHDLAIVVGNRNPAQLPSKAVQYLTLPIPRVAIVSGDPSDALSAYVRDKPGWMILPWDASAEDAAGAVAAHVERAWTAEQLAPPAHESWEAVAVTLVDILLQHTVGARPTRRERQAASRAIAAASSSHPR